MTSTDKLFRLGVLVTDRCNRGCSHCLVKAQDKGRQYLQPEQVRKLVIEAKALNYKIEGHISGMGEPLMNRKVVKIAEAFTGLKICREISFITSGFLAKDEDERALFRELITSHFREVLTINLSFNLYSPSFSERLEESIGELLNSGKFSNSRINMVCDRKNYFKTLFELSEIFYSIQTKQGIKWRTLPQDVSHESAFRVNFHEFLNQAFNEEEEAQLTGGAWFIPSIHKFESEDKGIHYLWVDPTMASHIGRAKNLPGGNFSKRNFRCRLIFGAQDDYSLYLGPDGKIFPACNCTLSGLQIGTWETPLQELFERKRALQKNLLQTILASKTLVWNKKHPCDACAAMAKGVFPFVGSSS